jgi:signal transduction histidine kinase
MQPETTGPDAPEPSHDRPGRNSGALTPNRVRRSTLIGAAGAAMACCWGEVWAGGAASPALAAGASLLVLGGMAVLLNLRAELARRVHTETVLRERQRGLAALLNNLPGVVFQRVQTGSEAPVYSYFNDRLTDFIGITPAEAIADSTRLSSHFDRKALREWRESLGAGLPSGETHMREFEIVDPIGSARWIMVMTRSRTGENGGRIWDAIATDISELKQWQEYLITAKEQAVLANRTKSQFLAVMSHELRTPLNAVIGFAEVLQVEFFGPLNDKQRGYVGDILHSGKHLLDIINDILDLAKIEVGKAELHEEVCAAAEIAASQVQMIRPRAEQAGLTVELVAETNLPLLYADQTKLKQMLLNLLTNAIKFTPGGGRITVALRLEAVPEADPMLALSIADTGVGMAPADIPDAFKSFHQIDNKLARNHEGAGLGLPLVKAQIELHGGTITMDSAVDAGTTATLRFPAWRLFRSIKEMPTAATPP